MTTPRCALVNGSAQGTLSPWDRGLLYGDGVFETMRAYDGEIFGLSDHVELLYESATALGIDASEARERLPDEAREAVARAGGGEQVVRLVLTRGEGAGAALRATGAPTRVVLAEPFTPPPASLIEQGARVACAPWPEGMPGGKTTSYLPRLLALGQARAGGYDEVVWSDRGSGGLVGASTANLVAVEGGKLWAPLPPGGRAGVTRRWVLGEARAWGLAVEEEAFRPDGLGPGGEIWLCSTLREVVSVVEVAGVRVGAGRPGPLGEAMRTALQRAGRGG